MSLNKLPLLPDRPGKDGVTSVYYDRQWGTIAQIVNSLVDQVNAQAELIAQLQKGQGGS
jgi:hypothetical protein